MRKKNTIETGVALEARIQRLLMCQGALAERALMVRPVTGAANLVTDVDIFGHDYSINFHHTRIYIECKGGKNVSTLDRVVWVRGMMSVLRAELGYLVLDHCNPESLAFASENGVEILQASGLTALENALHIGRDFWPGRANFVVYESVQRDLLREADGKASALQTWLQEALAIWREASALSLSYAKLNVLLGQLVQLSDILKRESLTRQNTLLYSFAVAALLVRLAQYVLFAGADTLAMTKAERESFITERLTSGNLGLEQTRRVMRSALNLAKAKLQEHGVEPPPNWDAEHLVTPPHYARAFVEVVDRVVADGHRARLLPLATEIKLFGFSGKEQGSSGLVKRVGYALPLTSLIRGFAIQALGIPGGPLVEGPAPLLSQVSGIGDESSSSPAGERDKPLLPGLRVI